MEDKFKVIENEIKDFQELDDYIKLQNYDEIKKHISDLENEILTTQTILNTISEDMGKQNQCNDFEKTYSSLINLLDTLEKDNNIDSNNLLQLVDMYNSVNTYLNTQKMTINYI